MNLLQKIGLKIVKKKIDKVLVEGPVMEGKPWYKSKGVISGIVTVGVSLYEGIKLYLAPQMGWELPPIPPTVYTVLGALGVYGRVTAHQPIGK